MLKVLEPPPLHLVQAISEGIARHNILDSIERINFAVVYNQSDKMVGGVTASVSFAVLFINNIWVDESQRQIGKGRALMLAAEEEGRKRGARTACVDTLSTQAPSFYEKLGYVEFGRLKGEAAGQPLDRIWYQKPLV